MAQGEVLGSFTTCWLSTWGQETSVITCSPAGALLNYKMALQCPFELLALASNAILPIFDVLITEYPTQVLKGFEKMKNVNFCPPEEGMGEDKTKKCFLKETEKFRYEWAFLRLGRGS